MKYGIMGGFVWHAFAGTAFDYLSQGYPKLEMDGFRKQVKAEYRAIVERTPSVGPASKNMFVVSMYAAAFVIALVKCMPEPMDAEHLDGLVRAASYSPLMRMAKEGKSAFTKREISTRTSQSAWSREHIDEYPMNWYWFFDVVEGEDEYFITHKQCGIVKLAEQEGVADIMPHLCKMDYYTLEMQGAVLDRTKTLGYGDDECNFHVMSAERAQELAFEPGDDAR